MDFFFFFCPWQLRQRKDKRYDSLEDGWHSVPDVTVRASVVAITVNVVLYLLMRCPWSTVVSYLNHFICHTFNCSHVTFTICLPFLWQLLSSSLTCTFTVLSPLRHQMAEVTASHYNLTSTSRFTRACRSTTIKQIFTVLSCMCLLKTTFQKSDTLYDPEHTGSDN